MRILAGTSRKGFASVRLSPAGWRHQAIIGAFYIDHRINESEFSGRVPGASGSRVAHVCLPLANVGLLPLGFRLRY